MGVHLAKMLFPAACLLVASALTGCAGSPEDLSAQPSTKATTRHFAESYQEVYRRLYNTAMRCGNVAPFHTEGQLFSDLGFGELAYSSDTLTGRNYYWKARVERAANGSTLTVQVLGMPSTGIWTDRVVGWAEGKANCS